jgi:hypothetical protein
MLSSALDERGPVKGWLEVRSEKLVIAGSTGYLDGGSAG